MKRLLNTLPHSAVASCGDINGARIWGYLVGISLVTIIVGSFFLPWTQTARGEGRVIAYSAQDRETPIRAPIDGRVVRWFVEEGQKVRKGDAIAELRDTDPNRIQRLNQSVLATQGQRASLRAAVTIAATQVRALEQARDAAIENAKLKISMAADKVDGVQQQLTAATARQRTAEINLKRQRSLNKDDLASDRQLELAILAKATAKSDADRARARLRAARRGVKSARATLAEIKRSHQARIEKARGELAKLRADYSKTGVAIVSAETKLARQKTQTVIRAPRDGRILAITGRQGTEFVKAGQSIATLVPSTSQRAVEIWVDGNDAPLIRTGQSVRLQFEGWPAVQFVGWPSVAVGTFGGKVAFVDAASKQGRFRVVVLPDGDQTWPDTHYLRQGVRVRGWVLLNRVSVAFEIWRQLNGFPPSVAPPAATAKAKDTK